jgi:hypothetical protein
MSRTVRRGDAAGARHCGVTQLLVTFVLMAVAEWRKLVAEMTHAFAGKRVNRTASEKERFGGQ